MAYLKRILFLVIIGAAIALLAGTGHAQTATTDDGCPVGKFCFDRAEVEKMAEQAAELESLKAQKEAADKALAEQKQLAIELQIQLAYEQGRNSALEETMVTQRAIIEAMIPMLRKKRIGLNIF